MDWSRHSSLGEGDAGRAKGQVLTFFLGEGDVGTLFMPADSARMCPAILPSALHLLQVVHVLVDRAGVRISSPPLPPLLPDRHQRRNLFRAGQLVDQSAVLMRALVESLDGIDAEMGQVVTQLVEILPTQHLHFARIGTPSHGEHCTSRANEKRNMIDQVFAVLSTSALSCLL
jgi:hypothetical protein